ncbi:MAG TPA: hypothetical protein VD735_03630 [Candidatus Saccharimonadales bacterium]|nr:hypothetical protein [Candidatus Saccharimonadales bacterium]
MSMDSTYQPLYNKVDDLGYKVKDALDDPDNPAAQKLRDEVQKLEDEFEMGKTPRALEERVKSIMRMIDVPRSNPNSFMSVSDAVAFYDDFEDLRRAIRDLPSYQ